MFSNSILKTNIFQYVNLILSNFHVDVKCAEFCFICSNIVIGCILKYMKVQKYDYI